MDGNEPIYNNIKKIFSFSHIQFQFISKVLFDSIYLRAFRLLQCLCYHVQWMCNDSTLYFSNTSQKLPLYWVSWQTAFVTNENSIFNGITAMHVQNKRYWMKPAIDVGQTSTTEQRSTEKWKINYRISGVAQTYTDHSIIFELQLKI